MDNIITDELIENTYLFCWKKLADKEDAKDLAQEIVVNAMLILRSGKKIENFYGLYWQIARHKVADFYRHKRPIKVSLDDVENTLLGFDKSIGDFITQEELNNLSVSMNRLDSIHRDILVRFYIKGQSVKDIASDLDIPTGTVTGRLSDARKKLKESFETMENNKTEPDTKITNPVDFKINWFGNSNDAYCAITSLLDKQILFLCRNQEKSLKQICKEINAAPVFIEDSIKKLCSGNVLFEKSKGKYITDFTIFPETVIQSTIEKADQIAKNMNLNERYFEILLEMKEELLAENFYGNKLPWEYLLPYFIIRSDREFRKTVGADYIREKYAPSKYDRIWRYGYIFGEYKDVPDLQFINRDGIVGPGYNYNSFVSTKYGYIEIHDTIMSMKAHKDGKELIIDNERYNWLNPANIDLYCDLTKNPERTLNKKEEVVVADLISKGILKNANKGYEGTVPVISFATIDKWCKRWYEKFKPLAEEYSDAMYQMEKETLLPFIRQDLIWASMCFFFPLGIDLDSSLTEYAIQNNLVHFEEGTKASCAGIVILN